MKSQEQNKDLVLEEVIVPGYEKIIKVSNKKTKLQSYIAIHNTILGPALGGTRIYPYAKTEDALKDVLRLSKGMTYKSAIAEVGLGGGKAVIIAGPGEKNESLLLSFAEVVEQLQGMFITAEDVGCSVNDMMTFRKKTKYITGLPHAKSSGDPSKFTAWGTFRGIQSVLKRLNGSDSVEGKTIALQGIGSVGLHLLELLFWHGAKIIIADVNKEKVETVSKKYGIKAVSPEDILNQECDVLSPCALGGIINDESLSTFRCKAIAGCANNQLLTEEHGDKLHEKGILYAPDFVINSGGLINVSLEIEKEGYSPAKAREKTNKIYDTLMSIYDIAQKNKISTGKAAVELAEYRIKYKIGKRKNPIYFHHTLE
jgi:leucine dehydrogenase